MNFTLQWKGKHPERGYFPTTTGNPRFWSGSRNGIEHWWGEGDPDVSDEDATTAEQEIDEMIECMLPWRAHLHIGLDGWGYRFPIRAHKGHDSFCNNYLMVTTWVGELSIKISRGFRYETCDKCLAEFRGPW